MRTTFCLMILSALPLRAAGDAVIVNSGSTNTEGFRIVVEQSGKAVYTPTLRKSGRGADTNAKSRSLDLPQALVKRLYSDLDAGKPLAELPGGHCMKSASFGSSLTIEFAGEKTPDLSCPDHGNPRLQVLIKDANEIVKLF